MIDVKEEKQSIECWLKSEDQTINLEVNTEYAKKRNTDLKRLLCEKLDFITESGDLLPADDKTDASKMVQLTKTKIVFINEIQQKLAKKPKTSTVDYK